MLIFYMCLKNITRRNTLVKTKFYIYYFNLIHNYKMTSTQADTSTYVFIFSTEYIVKENKYIINYGYRNTQNQLDLLSKEISKESFDKLQKHLENLSSSDLIANCFYRGQDISCFFLLNDFFNSLI